MKTKGKHLVVFGAGGNIGSHLVPLLARLPGVTRLTLVDFDRYEAKNLQSQAITASDIGQPKALVQARLARRINSKLEVVPIAKRLENVPLGCLRGEVILAGLDSKESRRCANEIAWRLGVPWIDAGVEPSLLLARLNVYLPAADQPCLECGWGERDYAELPTIHPCDAGVVKTPPTNSPACLGALAAALAAIECQKLLTGQSPAALIGRQVLIEAATHKQFITTFRRNPDCRFSHATWKISPLHQTPQELSLGAILKRRAGDKAAAGVNRRQFLKAGGRSESGGLSAKRLAPTDAGGCAPKDSASLAFGGQALAKRLDCPACGFTRCIFRLQHRLRRNDRFCDRCGREMLSAGFHMKTKLSRADLGPGDADRSLASLGLRAGDVISLSNGAGEQFYELGAGPVRRPRKPKSMYRRNS